MLFRRPAVLSRRGLGRFRLPGESAAAQKTVAAFLEKKEQLGPNGAVWVVDHADTYVFEDTLYFTFHLRPNVQWHDGTPLTVKDYLFSFKAMKDPEDTSKTGHASNIANYAGFLAPKVALFSNILLMVIVLLWRPEGLYSVGKQ